MAQATQDPGSWNDYRLLDFGIKLKVRGPEDRGISIEGQYDRRIRVYMYN
jgi:hypothetical protein